MVTGTSKALKEIIGNTHSKGKTPVTTMERLKEEEVDIITKKIQVTRKGG